MNKVCVIAGQSGFEIVKEFQKRNIEVLLICGKSDESGSNIADELLVIDLINQNDILKSINSYSEYVFFGTGHLLAISLAKKCFAEGKIINFNVEAAGVFKNKISTHKFIKSMGFNTPLLCIINDLDDTYQPQNYPVILKSEEDTYKTEMVSDVESFLSVKLKILESGSKVIVERFIDGYEVTIPLKATEQSVIACTKALEMRDINKKAVSILKGFDLEREYKKYSANKYIVPKSLKESISRIVTSIIKKSGFTGYPRFDIMIDDNDDIFIMEVNSIMVSAVGGSHYPWGDVGMNPSSDMVELFIEVN